MRHEIPTVAFTDTPGVRIFQTTSPIADHWRERTKQEDVELYFMDLWSTEEIEDLAYIVLAVAAQLSDQVTHSASFFTPTKSSP
jgi:hypothetical protein